LLQLPCSFPCSKFLVVGNTMVVSLDGLSVQTMVLADWHPACSFRSSSLVSSFFVNQTRLNDAVNWRMLPTMEQTQASMLHGKRVWVVLHDDWLAVHPKNVCMLRFLALLASLRHRYLLFPCVLIDSRRRIATAGAEWRNPGIDDGAYRAQPSGRIAAGNFGLVSIKSK
jgi:hypothetical protein